MQAKVAKLDRENQALREKLRDLTACVGNHITQTARVRRIAHIACQWNLFNLQVNMQDDWQSTKLLTSFLSKAGVQMVETRLNDIEDL
jgi:hypothetical protein